MSSAADFGTTLNRLYATILQRRGDSSPDSYTARLFSKGRRKIAQKVGEEAIETALAAGSADDAGVVAEFADLLYHLCVLWADCGLTLDDIAAELARREGVSGLAEKASRKE